MWLKIIIATRNNVFCSVVIIFFLLIYATKHDRSLAFMLTQNQWKIFFLMKKKGRGAKNLIIVLPKNRSPHQNCREYFTGEVEENMVKSIEGNAGWNF